MHMCAILIHVCVMTRVCIDSLAAHPNTRIELSTLIPRWQERCALCERETERKRQRGREDESTKERIRIHSLRHIHTYTHSLSLSPSCKHTRVLDTHVYWTHTFSLSFSLFLSHTYVHCFQSIYLIIDCMPRWPRI